MEVETEVEVEIENETRDRGQWPLISALECGGQGRNRTADASLFRAALYRLSYLADHAGEFQSSK